MTENRLCIGGALDGRRVDRKERDFYITVSEPVVTVARGAARMMSFAEPVFSVTYHYIEYCVGFEKDRIYFYYEAPLTPLQAVHKLFEGYRGASEGEGIRNGQS